MFSGSFIGLFVVSVTFISVHMFSLSLSRAYQGQSLPVPLSEAEVFEAIVGNLVRVYKELPSTPVRSALLAELTRDIPVVQAANALGLHHSSVSRASEYADRPFVEYLRQLGFPRKNCAAAHEFLLDWLGNDANCPYPSGSNRRCYTGSPELMWAEYVAASLAESIAPLHFEAFHDVRRRERVGMRSGDIFINREEVELAEIRAKIDKGEARAEEWAERIAVLEKNLAFCKERKRHYRESHQQLKGNAKKMIVTLDFTATQTGMQDKFTDFVVVVCTDQPLEIPLELKNAVIEPVKPPMMKSVEKPELKKVKRRKKQEVLQSGGGRKLLDSFSQSKAKAKREPQLEQRHLENDNYKPCSSVFHFVLKRTDETPGQISPYVQWAMDFLFVSHDLGEGFEEIHLFSDGCGKHFKTYPTHWYAHLLLFRQLVYLISVGILLIFNNACVRIRLATIIATLITTALKQL